MMMKMFYNPTGIGDVLIIPIKEGNRYTIAHENYGDVVKIVDNETKEVLGYNIFQASTYFTFPNETQIVLNEDWKKEIEEVFNKNGLNESFDVDLSPKFVVGLVKEKKQHDNADKLSVCQVDIGNEVLQIVCGAPNVAEGQKVVVAKIGAIMPSGLMIKASELRGVPSYGMICSAKELGLPNAPKEKGILVLSDEYEVGQAFQ
jgi:tRNA-binding protein